MKKIDEHNIVAMVEASDVRGALSAIYTHYARYLFAIAQRYVADDDKVNDVLQDAFVKVYSSISAFKWNGNGSLKAWLKRIVVNEALLAIRSETHHGTQPLDDNIDVTDDDAALIDKVDTDVLMQSIRQLPTDYRSVFNLYVLDGYSHKEIAQQLGITTTASAVKLLRAKKILKMQLLNYIDSHE